MDIWALIYALRVVISLGGGANFPGSPKYVVFGCFVLIGTYPSELKTAEQNLKIDPEFCHLLPTPRYPHHQSTSSTSSLGVGSTWGYLQNLGICLFFMKSRPN